MADPNCNDPKESGQTKAPRNRRKLAGASPSGAVYRQTHMERDVKIYPIDETGMKMLAMLNDLSTFFFSAAVFCATTAFDLWSGIEIENSPAENAKHEMGKIEWVCLVLGIGCFLAGCYAVWSRNTEISRIKRESREVTIN